jgi:hypothetical protein
MTDPLTLGLRVVGPLWSRRRLVIHDRAFAACCAADPMAEPECESFLTAFHYGGALADYLRQNGGSEKGFAGSCWAPWLWFDVDSDVPAGALEGVRQLAMTALERYKALDEKAVLAFLSGSKGYHLGLPTSLFRPAPSPLVPRAARAFALSLAALAGVTIDAGVYTTCRLFRAPNSRHPRTGLHKRRLTLDELMSLSAEGIRRLAAEPLPFDVPGPTPADPAGLTDWRGALQALQAEARPKGLPIGLTGMPQLNRLTMEFIREGAAVGDRHRLLFSAAANLAELGCPAALAHALLTESALDSGLPPAEVRRQIECGLSHRRREAGDA